MPLWIEASIAFLMLALGFVLGWLSCLRGGYFLFHTGNMQEDPMSFEDWRDRHLRGLR